MNLKKFFSKIKVIAFKYFKKLIKKISGKRTFVFTSALTGLAVILIGGFFIVKNYFEASGESEITELWVAPNDADPDVSGHYIWNEGAGYWLLNGTDYSNYICFADTNYYQIAHKIDNLSYWVFRRDLSVVPDDAPLSGRDLLLGDYSGFKVPEAQHGGTGSIVVRDTPPPQISVDVSIQNIGGDSENSPGKVLVVDPILPKNLELARDQTVKLTEKGKVNFEAMPSAGYEFLFFSIGGGSEPLAISPPTNYGNMPDNLKGIFSEFDTPFGKMYSTSKSFTADKISAKNLKSVKAYFAPSGMSLHKIGLSYNNSYGDVFDKATNENGTPQVVAGGSNKTFSIQPKDGYYIKSITLDGSNVEDQNISLVNIQADHLITVDFASIDTCQKYSVNLPPVHNPFGDDVIFDPDGGEVRSITKCEGQNIEINFRIKDGLDHARPYVYKIIDTDLNKPLDSNNPVYYVAKTGEEISLYTIKNINSNHAIDYRTDVIPNSLHALCNNSTQCPPPGEETLRYQTDCREGTCQYPPSGSICNPACGSCQTCVNSSCQSSCNPGQTCDTNTGNCSSPPDPPPPDPVLPQTHKIDVIGDISNCQITPSVSVNVQDGASQNISIQCFITSRFGNRIIGKDMTDFSCHTTYGDNDCGTLGQNEANWSRTYSPVSDDITITITNGSELAPEDSGEVVSGGSIVGNSAVILNDSKSNTGVRPVFSNLLTENLPAIANRSVVAKPIFGAAVLADKFFDRGLNLFNLASSLIQNVSQTIIDAFQNIII